MTQVRRIANGGRIDRGKPVGFTFNGRRFQGFLGDTLASALLANGQRLVARSFKYHRPRGIFACGPEEPNALVQLEAGAHTVPNLRATQVELYDGLTATSVNAWPSAAFDLQAVNDLFAPLLPAGFYYKTFMWPPRLWHWYESVIRGAAGIGRAPALPDPDTYDHMHVHCDVLVVGGGPAGISAALAAMRCGARVVLADEQNEFGGALLGARDQIDGGDALDWVSGSVAELAKSGNVRVLSRTTAFGHYDHNHVALIERRTDHLGPASGGVRQRVWKVRARQVVLATGAHERPVAFRGNDRPGVMLASAAAGYVNRYAVRPGRKAVVFATNDGAYRSAVDMADGGIEVIAIVDPRPGADQELPSVAAGRGFNVLAGHAVVDVRGRSGVRTVEVMRIDETGQRVSGGRHRFDCDLLAVSGGWNPVVHLHCHAGGRLAFDAERGCFLPGATVQASRAAGAAAGDFGLAECLVSGHEAGLGAAREAGARTRTRKSAPTAVAVTRRPPCHLWEVPAATRGDDARAFVDLHYDVTAADIRIAAREGYHSVEHLKRYTTLGMAPDQGKTSNVAGLAIFAGVLGRNIAEVGTTTFRPPYLPVTYGALAGRNIGDLADPVRRTPMHHWHESAGAVFEDVGQWKRPWYYPRPGESMRDAVDRECLAARNAVGIVDSTTLGKIDIQGRDALTLLNRVYCNGWDSLAVGRCRYGLMLGEDGMVFDDGVTARLGEHHYLMSTTSGGAGRVFAWLENWLQTEWPELDVRLTSVTEQWASIGVYGPNARRLLTELAPAVALDTESFPFMSVRDGAVAGVPARIFRISFSGETGWEINVAAGYGVAVWQALMTAGEKYGVTPYGTEALHVLRAEKGFIIAGQDTDGTTTPHDLGLGRMVSTRKDFLGRRSLSRSDTVRADRKQLVGLLTDDPQEVIPEGAQLVAEMRPKPPMAMIGHVTSSYYSANCGRSIALALIRDGNSRMGQTVHAPLETRTVAATVVAPIFYDPEGHRLHG